MGLRRDRGRTGRERGRALVVVRGGALFFGLFSLANAAVALVSGRSEDLWWIDLSVLSPVFAVGLGLACACLLITYAVGPNVRGLRYRATAAAFVALAVFALRDALAFFAAWREGTIAPGIAVPFSLVLAVGFALSAGVVVKARSSAASPKPFRRVVVAALGFALLFPLAHVLFFGTTDYRRPARVAVVLGAKVHENGALSSSLRDRVETAVELYQAGLVRELIMSGGVGASHIDEAAAMRDHAVRLGVPYSAIRLDSMGVDTDSTVANTVRVYPPGTRMLVVSQFYHLPRIKMAYRAAGRNVFTVPARAQRSIGKTPLFVLREIPGFWVYWARSAARDLTE